MPSLILLSRFEALVNHNSSSNHCGDLKWKFEKKKLHLKSFFEQCRESRSIFRVNISNKIYIIYNNTFFSLFFSQKFDESTKNRRVTILVKIVVITSAVALTRMTRMFIAKLSFFYIPRQSLFFSYLIPWFNPLFVPSFTSDKILKMSPTHPDIDYSNKAILAPMVS